MEDGTLPAGDFSAWLAGMQRALREQGESDVPCDGCTACCRSSQFVHIAPEETETLAHIPAELLFPAPRRPEGHVVLGYDEQGHCPMLGEGGCSIYEHRPRACRTYDCRVFPAAGVGPEAEDQAAVARRARRWAFDHPTARDRAEHDAVRAAARFVRDHQDELPDGAAPANATHRAVLAVDLHELFLGQGDARPDPEAVRVVLTGRPARG